MKSTSNPLADIEAIFVDAAIAAGEVIMAAVADRLTASRKADGSPVTQADLRAEEVIREHLGRGLPGVRIVGEEGGDSAKDGGDGAFILVDPLDGTRDCLAGSPEFTVNIALIEEGRPVLGVLYAPALGHLYAGGPSGAWRIEVPAGTGDWRGAPRRELRGRPVPDSGPVSLESRSHREPATEALADWFKPGGRRAVGSSLKFALVAAGEADLYARAVSLNQWDIAAGDAVLTAAGGAVVALDGQPIRYGGDNGRFKAPPFVAIGDTRLGRVLRSGGA